MPPKAVLLEKKYAVGSAPVSLTVLVGDRQYGSSMVFLDDELVANGDISDLPLGAGGDLAGREVTIYTVVTDIRSRKAELSVMWSLSGGLTRATYEKSSSAGKALGSRMFKAVFSFTQKG